MFSKFKLYFRFWVDILSLFAHFEDAENFFITIQRRVTVRTDKMYWSEKLLHTNDRLLYTLTQQDLAQQGYRILSTFKHSKTTSFQQPKALYIISYFKLTLIFRK